MSRFEFTNDAKRRASQVICGDISDERPSLAGTEPVGAWTAVAVSDDIPVREGRVVHVGSKAIAVFNLGDHRFMAVDNTCPHKGGPLSDGIMTGGSVVCPLHAWRINLTSGEVERPCAAAPAVNTYATRLESGVVHVMMDR